MSLNFVTANAQLPFSMNMLQINSVSGDTDRIFPVFFSNDSIAITLPVCHRFPSHCIEK